MFTYPKRAPPQHAASHQRVRVCRPDKAELAQAAAAILADNAAPWQASGGEPAAEAASSTGGG